MILNQIYILYCTVLYCALPHLTYRAMLCNTKQYLAVQAHSQHVGQVPFGSSATSPGVGILQTGFGGTRVLHLSKDTKSSASGMAFLQHPFTFYPFPRPLQMPPLEAAEAGITIASVCSPAPESYLHDVGWAAEMNRTICDSCGEGRDRHC